MGKLFSKKKKSTSTDNSKIVITEATHKRVTELTSTLTEEEGLLFVKLLSNPINRSVGLSKFKENAHQML